MAQEIIAAYAGLEGKVARKTAIVPGDQLRLINSYYSNLIEGHKTTIPDISMAVEILNMSERNARRIVSALLKDGLLLSQSHRAPLMIGLPFGVLPYYFPDLYDPLSNW